MQNIQNNYPIYAYKQDINDFQLFVSKEEWEKQFTINGAISYLQKHLQKSLKDDFYPIYTACIQYNVGYFALPRIIFPYITFLGTLLHGKDSSKNAIDYMNKYLSKANKTFKDRELCEFIYLVYRHGLAHTNMPKVVSENSKVFGWRIVFNDAQHLDVEKSEKTGKSALLTISPKKLADEVIKSIDDYIIDLQNGIASFDSFKEGFISMTTTFHYLSRGKADKIKIPNFIKANK